MESVEIRVHPAAAAYMTTLASCIEAAVPLVSAGFSYSECENAIRTAALEALELNGVPGHTIGAFMCIVQTAFEILSKKKRGD